MTDESIDDGWGELLGEEMSGPIPAVAPSLTQRVPSLQPVSTVQQTQRAPLLGPVPTVQRTQRVPLTTPVPRAKKRSDSPVPRPATRTDAAELGSTPVSAEAPTRRPLRVGRKTASVVALGTPAVQPPRVRASGVPSTAPASSSSRHATRRLVVRAPGSESEDDGPLDDSLRLPGVPGWAGESESNPTSIEAVTVPEASDVIDIGPHPAFDASAEIRLDLAPELVQDPPSAPERDRRPAPTQRQEHVPRVGARADVSVARPIAAAVEGASPRGDSGGWAPVVPWLLGSAALLVFGGVAWMARAQPQARPQAQAAEAVAVAAVVPAPSVPAVVPLSPKTMETPAAVVDLPPTDEAEPPAEPEAAPEVAPEAEAEAEAESEPVRDATMFAVGTRYAEAAGRYQSDGSQEALEIMAKAACEMFDGARARSAFRKLRGGDVRSSVMIACRKTAIDLTAKGDGPTPEEMLRAAQRALDAGDHRHATELARASNRLERSQAAVLISALAACAAGDLEEATSLRRHLAKSRQKTLDSRCDGTSPAG